MRLSSRTIKVATVAGAVFALLSSAVAAAGVAAAPPAGGGAPAVSGPWSQTDFNAAQSRANLTERTLTRSAAGRIEYLRGMAAPVNPPGFSACQNTPVVAPVLTGGGLYAVTDNWLTKYDPATGRVLWRRNPDPTFENFYQALAVAGGLVVLGGLGFCDSASVPGGFVEAFSASTGTLAWEASPFVVQHMVVSGRFVVSSGDTAGNGNVVTVDRLATGAEVWFRGQDDCCQGVTLVVARLVLSTASSDQNGHRKLIARKLSTGRAVWSRPGTWGLQRGDTDAASGRHVYLTNPRGTVVSLDPRTGKTQYSLRRAGQVLTVDATRAYATCGSLGICAYATATGHRLWHAQPGFVPAMAAEAGGVLYLDQGLALNSRTGHTLTTLWSNRTATSLAVGNGRIAVVTDPRVLDLYGLPGS